MQRPQPFPRVCLLLLALAACAKDPPPTPLPTPTPVAALPAPAPPLPPPSQPPPPTPGELLLVALANHATADVLPLLATNATLTTAHDDTCVGAGPCAELLALVLDGTRLQVERLVHAGDRLVVQGSARKDGSLLPFAAVVSQDAGRVTLARYYGSTVPWRFVPRSPALPLAAPPTPAAADVVRGEPLTDAAKFADALAPANLAEDPTAHGLVAADVRWHDAATGKTTVGAEDNRQALRAFLQHFGLLTSEVVAVHSAGPWVVVERLLVVALEAPVVPVPPTLEVLRVRTLEIARVADGKVAEVWAYSDPVAFVAAVEMPAVATLH